MASESFQFDGSVTSSEENVSSNNTVMNASTQRSLTRRQQSTARKNVSKKQGRPPVPLRQSPRRPRKNIPMSTAKRNQLRFLKEVKRLQNCTDPLIPRLCFARLVRELIMTYSSEINRISVEALAALQESTEVYVTQVLHDAYLLALHRGRITLTVKDLDLLKGLRIQ